MEIVYYLLYISILYKLVSTKSQPLLWVSFSFLPGYPSYLHLSPLATAPTHKYKRRFCLFFFSKCQCQYNYPLGISMILVENYWEQTINDKECLSEIENDDIVDIMETRIHNLIENELNILGFHCVKNKNRCQDKHTHQISGRLSLFVNKALEIRNPNTNENPIWVKVKTEVLHEKKDIFIGTIYFTPRKSNSKKIMSFSKKTCIFRVRVTIFYSENLMRVQT